MFYYEIPNFILQKWGRQNLNNKNSLFCSSFFRTKDCCKSLGYIILLFIYGVVNVQTVYGQANAGSNVTVGTGAFDTPQVRIQPIVLDMCNAVKHIYFKINFDKQKIVYQNIKTISISIKDNQGIYATHQVLMGSQSNTVGAGEGEGNQQTFKRDTFPWSVDVPDYFELEVYNLIGVGNYLDLVFTYYDSSSTLLGTTTSTVSLIKDTTGIVDVTDHMGAWIDKYMDEGKGGSGLMTYFCGKEISQIELIAFFKDYFKWTDIEICSFVYNYNFPD